MEATQNQAPTSNTDPGPLPKRPDAATIKKELGKSIDRLPPMPEVVFKAQAVLNDPNSSFKDLAITLVADQAIAARVLRLANSPYYGLSGTVSSLQQASVVLGAKTLSEILTVAASSGLMGRTLDGYGMDARTLWHHSLAVAFGSRMIAERTWPRLADDAFAAGLIHDAGKLALDPLIKRYRPYFDRALAEGMTYLDAEKAVFGIDHCHVASTVCRAWKVPEALSRAIASHHYPSKGCSEALCHILHAADCLDLSSSFESAMDAFTAEIEPATLTFLELEESDLARIRASATESVKKTASALSS